MTHRLVVFILIMTGFFLYVNPAASSAGEIVNPHVTYTFSQMERDIRELERTYPHLIQVEVIGRSEYGRPIYAVGLGTGNATTFINGSHHAREWISTSLNMYMIDQYARMHEGNRSYGGFNVRKVLDETTIWFVPMLNPDGVILQQQGLSAFPASMHPQLRRMNEGSTNFRRWKANAKGVDLNRQYAAGWNTIRYNTSQPSWTHHKGYSPMSSAETKAIVNFTRKIDPEIAVSYHSSGEVLFWKYKQTGSRLLRDQRIARQISQYTGYRMIDPGPNPSGGGYTDWFIETYQRPAVTPELGVYAGHTHVPVSAFGRIWNQNRYVGLYTASEGYQLYLKRGGEPKPPRVEMTVNGSLVNTVGSYEDGTVMAPFKETLERTGLLVHQTGDRQWTVRQRETLVELTEGRHTYSVNGESFRLPQPFQERNGQWVIPVRPIIEAFGHQTSYSSSSQRLLIETVRLEPDVTPPLPPTVNGLTDITERVSGTSEVNAMIQILRDGQIIGQNRAGVGGRFEVSVPASPAGTALTIRATDLAGNRSNPVVMEVAYTSLFTDSVGHWAESEIGLLKDRRITTGYTDGRFGVQDSIRRAEAAALLVRTIKEDDELRVGSLYPDVASDHFFFGYIHDIRERGIMSGDANGLFHPERAMTRAEMAKVIAEAFISAERLSSDDVSPGFADVPAGHWASRYIAAIASTGLTSGYPDGTFRPDQPIARSEFAAFLARAIGLDDSVHRDAGEITDEEESYPEEDTEEDTQADPDVTESNQSLE